MATKPKLSSNNLVIVMLLVTLLVLGVSGLAAKTLYGNIVLNAKIADKKNLANSQLDKDVSAAPGLVSAYNALGQTSNVINDALPETADFPSLIVTLENITSASGVKLKNVTPLTASTTTGDVTTAPASGATAQLAPQAYDFTISASGTFDNMVKLFGALESSARPMRVLSVQLTGAGSAMSTEINVETYYQPKAQLPFGTETVK